MEPAAMLRNALTSAWSQTCDEYRVGHVTSERALQAVLFVHLRTGLPGYSIFCEPTMRMADGRTVVPDLLIARDQRVVAAVELKFVPHWFPVFERDVSKLRQYKDHSGLISLEINPDTGRFSDNKHSIAPDCLLVFASVGRHDATAMNKLSLQAKADLGDSFVPLTCEVGVAAQPAVAADDASHRR
jgi:hypothetical protein